MHGVDIPILPVIKHNKKFLQSLRPPCRKEMPMGPEKKRIYFTVVAVRSPEDPRTILYYATNMDIPEKSLEDIIDIYKKRWTIENAFKSQKLAFLAKTYSVNFAIRFFFWVLVLSPIN
ncbi:MAG: transposase [Candidatus Methanofastidiosia archaeon]